MANPKAIPPKEHYFKPGVSPNPGGKPRLKITKNRLQKIIDSCMAMTKEELIAVASDPKASMIELMVAAAAAKCVESGDWSKFELPLQRHMGKVADELVMPQPMVIKRPSGEQIELTTTAALEEGEENE
jgi:hypothetical protein